MNAKLVWLDDWFLMLNYFKPTLNAQFFVFRVQISIYIICHMGGHLMQTMGYLTSKFKEEVVGTYIYISKVARMLLPRHYLCELRTGVFMI